MTHDLLQSDIDLARRLIERGRPDSEIIAALAYRGIDSSRAANLVAALQDGKMVEPDKPIAINLPRKVSEETTTPADQRSRQSSPANSSSERRRNRCGYRRTDAFPWFMILAVASVVVCVTAFVLFNRKLRGQAVDRNHVQPADKSASDSNKNNHRNSSERLDAKGISLEVQQDGLRLCGDSVGREDFLSAIFKLLGTPSRTNEVEKLDHVIYAYDAYGVLVYSPRNSGNYSVVLDFEATDGAAGTKNPFVGIFKINNYVVHATTDAASLGLIKELGLEPPKSASGILRAQFGGLELVFAYFKSPERLSLAEIDFK